MYSDPLSFPRLQVDPAQSVRTANRAEGENAFADLYAEQMQAAIQEIGQASSETDSSSTADSSTASPIDDLPALLQLQAGWNSSVCNASNPLNLSGDPKNQIGAINLLQSRKAAKLYSGETTQSDSAGQPEQSTPAPSVLHRLISWLDSHAHLHSTHHCAASVRQGLEAAGIQTAGRPCDAGDYGQFLLQHGARAVDSQSYEPQAGDIAVFDKSDEHPAGHIQVFNGQRWVSDFVQQSFSPYRDQASTPPVTVYRLS